jgi:hypothetical protein
MGLISTKTGINNYVTACQACDQEYSILAFPTAIDKHVTAIITDDEHEPNESDDSIEQDDSAPPPAQPTIPDQEEQPTEPTRNHPIQATVTEPEMKDIGNEHPTFIDERYEYIHWHYRLNHATQKIMTKLAYKKMVLQAITKILKRMDRYRQIFYND